jgi:hypothetical protein
MNQVPTTVEKPPRIRVVFQFLLLGFLLILAPYASWHYLSKGVEYRQSRLAQMAMHGPVPSFSYSDQLGSRLTTEDWVGKVTLLGFGPGGQDDVALDASLTRMQVQFAEREDVQVLRWQDPSAEIISSSDLPAIIVERTALEGMLAQAGATPADKEGPVVFLIDSKRELRQYYHVDDQEEVRRLAEHTAILLPPQRINKPQLQRQPEK